MSRRSTKRKSTNQYADVIVDDDPTPPTHVSHRHQLVQVTDSGRSLTQTTFFNLLSSPKKSAKANAWTPPVTYTPRDGETSADLDLVDYATSGNFEHADFGLQSLSLEDKDTTDDNGLPKTKRSRREGRQHPLRQWAKEDRARDIREVLRMEGRGDYPDDRPCFDCSKAPSEYRCVDCEMAEMFCAECLKKMHAQNPLHCIKKWNGTFFERITLMELGLRVQLGHPANERCINPEPSMGGSFTVVHSNGIHEIALDYCDCETAQEQSVQLLRRYWFPATNTYPQSAATMRVLKTFHLLAFEGKCSPYEFYNSLARATDNTGIYKQKDRYDEFMRMYRQWSNLQMAKRAGRGHDSTGVDATAPGECALLCPACPHPGKNLPPDWQDAPPDKSWLYSLFVAIDANFRLTRKHVSSEELDPSLSDGWAFFVKNEPYREYLEEHWDVQQERSTCVNHEACNNADKVVKGKAVTGAGTADCSRHNLKRPCGFADLQKGERYVNMDYLVFSSLRDRAVKRLVLSYDIACQWHKNINERLAKIIPKRLHFDEIVTKPPVYLVPKFHLPAHIAECGLNFSFNYTKNVGRTDGEAPERGWSRTNQLATSTREMGPGFRRDTLDDHFNDWNWKKITGMGVLLWKKFQKAVPMAKAQRADFDQYTSTIAPEKVATFKSKVEKWEEDSTKQPNPFKPTVKTITIAQVKLLFAAEASKEAEQDTATIHSNMHPSELIAQGIQLEDQQRRLSKEVAALNKNKNSTTTNQLRECQEAANRLHRRINAWSRIQTLYLPDLAVIRETDYIKAIEENKGVVPELKVEDIELYLPSSLPENKCPAKFNEYEWKLREGQAYDALYDIRYQFRIKSHWTKHKTRFVRGVSDNTRSNKTLMEAANKITRAADKYRKAHKALVKLSERPGMDKVCTPKWRENLKELRDSDIRGLSDADLANNGKKQSEGTRLLSWIWKIEGAQDGPPDEELQIEWCKSRARTMRWEEEVDLLQEEMRRVLAFLEWQANWWKTLGGALSHVEDPITLEGMKAYRARQAKLRLDLKDRFQALWRGTDALLAAEAAEIPEEELGAEVLVDFSEERDF